mmetsp:Transcript_134688/g.200438  ORF Transcript_134688/g.200438 Transcript_134688/m.200438 type:complete len:298 (-) Transcript_134688:261-1154(-)
MFLQFGVVKHIVGISTNRVDLPGFKKVMLVQQPPRRISLHASLVNDGLPVIFTVRLQIIEFPQSVRRRIELQGIVSRRREQPFDAGVLNGNRIVLHQARIRETDLAGHVFEIVPIQSTRQAFSPQDFIVLQLLRHATVGVDVGKVEFATRLEQIQTLLQDGFLIGTQVDNAVGNDNVKGSGFQVEIRQCLQVPLSEFDVGKSKLVRVVVQMLGRHGELFFRHVHADDFSGRTDQLTGDVDVTPGAASQIQHVAPLEGVLRKTQSAAVVLGDDLGVDVVDCGLNVIGGRARGAAGVRF